MTALKSPTWFQAPILLAYLASMIVGMIYGGCGDKPEPVTLQTPTPAIEGVPVAEAAPVPLVEPVAFEDADIVEGEPSALVDAPFEPTVSIVDPFDPGGAALPAVTTSIADTPPVAKDPLELPEDEGAADVVAPAPLVRVVGSELAGGVEEREPVAADLPFGTTTDKVWAWVKIANSGPPTKIQMVWRKGDEVGATVTLDVGTSPSWRTWSYKTVRAYDVGDWSVDIVDANGVVVDTLGFTIEDERDLTL